MQPFVWYFCLAGIALALVGASLWWERRQKSGATALPFDAHTGETVRTEDRLQVGQSVKLAIGAQPLTGKDLTAQITALNAHQMTLSVEMPPSSRLFGANEAATSPVGFLGQPVKASVVSANNLYRFETAIVDSRLSSLDPRDRLIVVQRPTWLTRVQRRRYTRVRMQLPATIRHVRAPRDTVYVNAPDSPEEQDWLRRPLHVTVANLSGNGVCLQVERSLSVVKADLLMDVFAPGTILEVRLPVPIQSEMALPARVHAIQRIVIRGGLGIAITCEFLPMEATARESLLNFVVQTLVPQSAG